MNEKKSYYPITLLKRCFKSWLLPYPFKIVGGGLLLLLLIALVVDIIIGANEMGGDVTPSSLKPSLWHMAEYAILHIAIFFMACSREKNEDEMIAAMRGETLKEVCYLAFLFWVVYRLVLIFTADSYLYIVHDEPIVTPFVVWILYFGRFEYKLKALRKKSREFTL